MDIGNIGKHGNPSVHGMAAYTRCRQTYFNKLSRAAIRKLVSTTTTLLQYADDKAILMFCDYGKSYWITKPYKHVSETLSKIKSWSKNNNLEFTKTKTRCFFSLVHFRCNEIVKSKKLLEVKFDQYFKVACVFRSWVIKNVKNECVETRSF